MCLSPSKTGTVTELPNPVTRSMIRLNPPFRFETEEQLDEFVGHIEAYCTAAWNLCRMDPAEINAPYGWVAAQSYFGPFSPILPVPVDSGTGGPGTEPRHFDYLVGGVHIRK